MSRDLELVSISLSLMTAVVSNGAATAALLGDDKAEALLQLRAMTEALDEVRSSLRAYLGDKEEIVGD